MDKNKIISILEKKSAKEWRRKVTADAVTPFHKILREQAEAAAKAARAVFSKKD